MDSNIVGEWLRFMDLSAYAESFIENGYDDLEICKQVGEPDLDAIGVFNLSHREKILNAVRVLRQEGGAAVYFTLESARLPYGQFGSPYRVPDDVHKQQEKFLLPRSVPVKIPKIRLRMLVKEKLSQDGVRIGCPPYTNLDGTGGDLDGLASRYADEFQTHYQDVLDHLEEIRNQEWQEIAYRLRHLENPVCSNSLTPFTTSYPLGISVNAHQPLYVPGRYMPSSCLSDREEEEIYDWAYACRRRWKDKKSALSSISRYPKSCTPFRCDITCQDAKESGSPLTYSRKMSSSLANLFKTLSVKKKQKHVCCRQNNNLAADPLITPASPSMMLPSAHLKTNSSEQKITVSEALKKLRDMERKRESSILDSSQMSHQFTQDLSAEHKPAPRFCTEDSGCSENGTLISSHPPWYDDPCDSSESEEMWVVRNVRDAYSGRAAADERCEDLLAGSDVVSSPKSSVANPYKDAAVKYDFQQESPEGFRFACKPVLLPCPGDPGADLVDNSCYLGRVRTDYNDQLKGKLLIHPTGFLEKMRDMGRDLQKKIFRFRSSVSLDSAAFYDKRSHSTEMSKSSESSVSPQEIPRQLLPPAALDFRVHRVDGSLREVAIARARALVDCAPEPRDRSTLRFLERESLLLLHGYEKEVPQNVPEVRKQVKDVLFDLGSGDVGQRQHLLDTAAEQQLRARDRRQHHHHHQAAAAAVAVYSADSGYGSPAP